MSKQTIRGWLRAAGVVWGALVLGCNQAQAANSLQSVDFTTLPGDRVQVIMKMAEPVKSPASFKIDNPARVTFDFPETAMALPSKSMPIGVGAVRGLNAVEVNGRTRVVLNLVTLVPYESRSEGNNFIVLFEGSGSSDVKGVAAAKASKARRILDVDFRRGDAGEARIVIKLSDPKTVVDVREEGNEVIADFIDTQLPDNLARRLDVTDFATPVRFVDTFIQGRKVHMVIAPLSEYEYQSYQADDVMTIELRPLSKQEKEDIQKAKFQYTGDRLSLNFQDIEVRSVLQLLADFTDVNMVTSDTVKGNITLRLKNVPWDQALDIILQTKGLDKRQSGNVMQIAPREEIAAREKLDLEAKRQVEELAPLRSEFIVINYAKAETIAKLLKSPENKLLSERGQVTVDDRTNTLLVRDTAATLADVRKIVERLDKPVRQVLIESRIVIANNDFSRDLGARFGVTGVKANGSQGIIGTTGSVNGTAGTGLVPNMVDSAVGNIGATGQPFPVVLPNLADRLNVDLAVPGPSFALSILRPELLLDLELSALQQEGRGEVLSNPKVITSDQNKATIKQGQEIPYQEASASGATTTSFKEALLKMEVTPQITPDDQVIMTILVSKDNPDFSRSLAGGAPPIDKREVQTVVLVENGQTVVLGGVYEQTKTDATSKVPVLGDVPLLGNLFKTNSLSDVKQELLIFVTPRIVKDSIAAR